MSHEPPVTKTPRWSQVQQPEAGAPTTKRRKAAAPIFEAVLARPADALVLTFFLPPSLPRNRIANSTTPSCLLGIDRNPSIEDGSFSDRLLTSFLSTSFQKKQEGIFLSTFRPSEGRGEDSLFAPTRSPTWILKPASRSPSASSRLRIGKLRPRLPKPTPTRS